MNPDNLSFNGKIKAASKGKLKLIDDDGFVFWIDVYDSKNKTAYIHRDEGDSHLVSWDQLRNYEFVQADNSHLKPNEYQK